MNININTASINSNYQISGKSPASATASVGTDKLVAENTESIAPDFVKSDIYSNSVQNMNIKNYADLFSFVKKFLYNEQFREIAINSSPELKAAYENFMSAIEMDNSKLGDYIKSVLSDSSKFSGEFFDALNSLMLETTDISLKNSIYSFLKSFDYYFSQNENASGVNSAFKEILDTLPEDVKNALLKLLANSSSSKLNSFFMAAFSMNLPDKEKIKVILSYMTDFINDEVYSQDSNISDINKPGNLLNIFRYEKELDDEFISFSSKLISLLKNNESKLPEDIKALLSKLENAIKEYQALKAQGNYDASVHDKILSSTIIKNQTPILDVVNSLVHGSLSKPSNVQTSPENSLDNIVKFLVNLNNSASSENKSTINNIIYKLLSLKQNIVLNKNLSDSIPYNADLSKNSEFISNNKALGNLVPTTNDNPLGNAMATTNDKSLNNTTTTTNDKSLSNTTTTTNDKLLSDNMPISTDKSLGNTTATTNDKPLGNTMTTTDDKSLSGNMTTINNKALSELISAINNKVSENSKSTTEVEFPYNGKNIQNDQMQTLQTYNNEQKENIFTIFSSIRDLIFKSDAYPKEAKEQIASMSNNLADAILNEIIPTDVAKNKSELLLNVYEKEIVPFLLKNSSASVKNSMSLLTHNLLRLKLGTASEFTKQISALFSQLEYSKSADKEQAFYMKLGLIEKIISQNQENNGAPSAFLKLLDSGLKLSSNDLTKAVFENTVLSLISKNDVNSIYKHFFIPLLYNGMNVLSEILLSKDKVKNEEKNENFEESLDCFLKVTLILDIEKAGVFNTTLFYSDGQISARVCMPEKYKDNFESVEKDIIEIIQKNKIKPKKILVTEDI